MLHDLLCCSLQSRITGVTCCLRRRRSEEAESSDAWLGEDRRCPPSNQMGETEDEQLGQAGALFENFVQASTCKGTLQAFSILCRQLELDPLDHGCFYSCLKAAVSTWKVKPLWTKLDKRAQQKVYSQNRACQGTRVGSLSHDIPACSSGLLKGT